MSSPKIRVCGVKKSFNSKRVLDGVNLEVMPGESLVVIGLSGAGKSVLMKCILGLLRPDGGQILVDGEDWCTLSRKEQLERMRRIGMVFQGSALFDSLPVWKNVAFSLLQRGEKPSVARTRQPRAGTGRPARYGRSHAGRAFRRYDQEGGTGARHLP